MISSEMQNIARMLTEAITPNCWSTSLVVKMKAAKPRAVVAFVMNVALPTFFTIRVRARALLPCRLYSAWYLLSRLMQLGTPITIMSGGIRPIKAVSL